MFKIGIILNIFLSLSCMCFKPLFDLPLFFFNISFEIKEAFKKGSSLQINNYFIYISNYYTNIGNNISVETEILIP